MKSGRTSEEQSVFKKTDKNGQKHLLKFWDELNEIEKDVLIADISGIDFELFNKFLKLREETEVVNIGTAQEAREVRISALLSPEARAEFIAFLKEYADVFAWSYEDMVGLDVEIVVHNLAWHLGSRTDCALQLRFWTWVLN